MRLLGIELACPIDFANATVPRVSIDFSSDLRPINVPRLEIDLHRDAGAQSVNDANHPKDFCTCVRGRPQGREVPLGPF
jgi:hypothetical protein